MSSEQAIEMFVVGIVLDPRTQAPVVVLKNENGDRYLPIWIGVAEATSIAEALKQADSHRPLTHDLMYTLLVESGMRTSRVVITDLKDSTYFSELVISHGDKVIVLDARPSDSIAMAVRFSAPIYVLEHVLDQAQIAFAGEPTSELSGPENIQTEGGDPEIEELEPVVGSKEENAIESGDLRTIDKDQWAEILKKLNPDDFKYEM